MIHCGIASVGLIRIRKITMPLPLAPLFVASQLLITVADSVPQLNVRPWPHIQLWNRVGNRDQELRSDEKRCEWKRHGDFPNPYQTDRRYAAMYHNRRRTERLTDRGLRRLSSRLAFS